MESMMMKDIRRVNLREMDQPIEATDSEVLATKAVALLGYTPLQETFGKTDKVTALKPLQIILAELEIDPLNGTDVTAYKIQECIEANRRGFEAHIQEVAADLLKKASYINWAFYGIRWGKTPMSDYKEPIPVYVVNKACQIAEKANELGLGVTFEVEHLEENPDPFLIVTAQATGETYYIEVWNEPRFEAKQF